MPAAANVAVKLVVIAGPDEGKEVPLAGKAEIGADPSCDLVLRDGAVSRRHASVSNQGGRIVVCDLGSRNGTFLGGIRLREAEVQLGAVLTLGKTQVAIESRWRVREVAPSEAREFGGLSGESMLMREVFAILERVAPSDVTVLVEGESGTGKELAARSIHQMSPRSAGPYVVFDCGAVPRELAESELFGHKRGAFSGATADRGGAFQRAHGGTLCLDEIGELPLDLQPKLLRALETSEIRAVGDDLPRKLDVRIVASTNRDLQAEAHCGRFRSDLLYRLEVVKVRLPPLRQRPEDIPLLLAKLLDGKLPPGDRIDGENLRRLMRYGWPGNVRELKNALARASTLAHAPGTAPAPFEALVFNLGPAAAAPLTIGAEYPGVSCSVPYKEAKAQLLLGFDRAYVAALLKRHRRNIQQAAQAAGLSRKHLYDLVRRVEGEEADES
jgi:two-component system, NtrC family, nitrogen regulation response regulator GlnG